MKTKNVFAATLAWTIALAVLTSCDRSDFTSFLRRDATYYARLAAACDKLLAKGPVTGAADSRAFAKDTNSLPQAVRELHPSHIEIRPNSVLLSVGTYFVLWKASDQDQRVWVLIAYREGHEKQVFKRNVRQTMNRGDRREPIFEDDRDRQRFLDTLGEACEKTRWQVHAFQGPPQSVESRLKAIFQLVIFIPYNETTRANLTFPLNYLVSPSGAGAPLASALACSAFSSRR